MNNKEMAISFLRLASSGNVREAYETYVHPDFRHHNPYFPGDRASLLAGMEENAATFPRRNLKRCGLLKMEIWWQFTGEFGSRRVVRGSR
jgi:predicted SnoaL-like aldol condensation-catalyzing enzyme